MQSCKNRQAQHAPPRQPQPQQPIRPMQQPYSPAQLQSALEQYRASQARIAEEENSAVQKYPD